ncbi:MAG: hypothetical protein M1838_001073 [Thelocarpon superellum]|nr:MAG: hypothetical protein M1838_001073 [Thelocarpon superellum]
MAPNDVTVDIPLNNVRHNGSPEPPKGSFSSTTNPSDRSEQSGYEQYVENEKQGLFRRQNTAHNGKRRVAKEVTKEGRKVKRGADGEEQVMTRMGQFYDRILNFSLVTRYFIYVLPLALAIAVPIVIGATAAPRALIGGVRIVWFFTWIEIIWLSLWVSKLFARTTPYIFQFLCGIVSSGTRKYATVLEELEIPMSLVGWALASWATFIPMMTCNPTQRAQIDKGATCAPQQEWEGTLSNVLAAFLVASLVFLTEKFLIQLISISYHRKQFDLKIKTSKHHVHLLSLLYEASRAMFPAYCNDFAEEDYIINDSLNVGHADHNSPFHRSGAATPMKLVRNIGRMGDKLTSAFGNVAQEITGKEVFNPNAAHSIVVEALERHASSEALAKRLWMSFVVEGKEALFREDMIEVLGAGHSDEAQEAFDAIDADSNGDISLDEMIAAVVQFSRERYAIANSVHDVDQAIKVLDNLLCVVVLIIVILVFVGFLNASFTTTLATAGTALLSMSFVFASTAAEVLGSCIFLFVKHPYDVGDRVDITKEQLTVEHISLLFTVFKRVDNHKIVQIPNTVLNQNWIENISRSKAMREYVSMFIHFDTTFEDIQLLKREMYAFVTSKEHNRDFQPDIDVEVVGIAEMNKLELRVEIRHKSNWSNETLRAMRRSKFMCALVLALRKIPIYAPGGGDAALGDMAKATYSVSISDDEAKARREEFAAKKEAKRLVPLTKTAPAIAPQADVGKPLTAEFLTQTSSLPTDLEETRPSTAGASERTAVDSLTTKPRGTDSVRDDWAAYRDQFGSIGQAAGKRSLEEPRESLQLEEVKGMLSRESSRGKRKASAPPTPVKSHAVPAGGLERPRLPRIDSASTYASTAHHSNIPIQLEHGVGSSPITPSEMNANRARVTYSSVASPSQYHLNSPAGVPSQPPPPPPLPPVPAVTPRMQQPYPPAGRPFQGNAFALTQHPVQPGSAQRSPPLPLPPSEPSLPPQSQSPPRPQAPQAQAPEGSPPQIQYTHPHVRQPGAAATRRPVNGSTWQNRP